MKTLSITQLKRMPVRELERLISRHEVAVTIYGKPVVIMVPMGPHFSVSKLRDLEQKWGIWDEIQKNKTAAQLIAEARIKLIEESREPGRQSIKVADLIRESRNERDEEILKWAGKRKPRQGWTQAAKRMAGEEKLKEKKPSKLRGAPYPKLKGKPSKDWEEEMKRMKAAERRLEEEKWARIFPRGKSGVLDAAHEMTRDLRKAGVKVDVSRKHDKYFAQDVAERKASPKSKPAPGKSKHTSKRKKTR